MTRRRILWSVIVVAIVLVGFDLVARTISLERQRTLIEQELSEALGEPVRINGHYYLDLVPSPRIEAGDITVGDQLEIGEVELELDLLQLIQGSIRIDGLDLNHVELRLDAAAEDTFEDAHEVDQLAEELATEPGSGGDGFEIRRVEVEDIRILLVGEPGDPVRSVFFETLLLETDELDERIALETRGEFEDLPFEMSGSLGPLSDVIVPGAPYEVRLRGSVSQADFELEGTLPRADRMEGLDIAAQVNIPDLMAWLPEEARDLAPLGPLVASARLRQLEDALRLDEVSVRLESGDGLLVELSGGIDNLEELAGLALDIRVRVKDLGVIDGFAGRRLPPLGPLVASARVEGDVSAPRVRDLDAELGQPGGAWARLSGGIDDLRQLRGLDFQLAAEADDLGVLEELAGQPLPPLTPVVAAARLVGDFPMPRLEKLDVELGRRGQTFAQVSGAIDDLRQLQGMDLELILEADDLELLEELAQRSLPALGPLVARAHLSGDASTPRLDRLDAQLGRRSELWTQLTGSIGDLLELRGVALSAEVSAPDIRVLGTHLERDLPDLGPLSGTAELVDADGTLGIERFHLRAGRRGELLVEVSGGFDDLAEIDEIEVDVQLEARDLALIGRLAGVDLPTQGPVLFTGRAAGSDELLRVNGDWQVDTTRITADASASFAPETRPSIRVSVGSPHVHLDDLISQKPAEKDEKPAEAEGERSSWWDSETPLPFERLHDLDLDVAIDIERITGRGGLDVSGTHLTVVLGDGELVIRQVGEYEAGGVQVGLRVDARPAVPELELAAEIAGVDLTRLVSQFQPDTEFAGVLHASTQLSAQGRTVPALRSSVSGRFAVTAREGTVASEFGRAFVFNLIRSLWPNRKLPKDAPVHCMLAAFEIHEGVAHVQRLFVDAPEAAILGTGRVDLGNGTLQLRLVPRARNPGLVSIVPSVHVIGPLDDPSIRVVKRSLATSVVRGLGSNVLRPGNVARKRMGFRSKKAVEDPCAGALTATFDGEQVTEALPPVAAGGP